MQNTEQKNQEAVKPTSQELTRPSALGGAAGEQEGGNKGDEKARNTDQASEKRREYSLKLLQRKSLVEQLRKVDHQLKLERFGILKSREGSRQFRDLEEQERRIQAAKRKSQEKAELFKQALRVKQEEWSRLEESRREEKRREIGKRLQEMGKRRQQRSKAEQNSREVLARLLTHSVNEAESQDKQPQPRRSHRENLRQIRQHQQKYLQMKELIRQRSEAKRGIEHSLLPKQTYESSVFSKAVREEQAVKAEELLRFRRELSQRVMKRQLFSDHVKQAFKPALRRSSSEAEQSKAQSQGKGKRRQILTPLTPCKKPTVIEILGGSRKRKQAAAPEPLPEPKKQPKYRNYLAEQRTQGSRRVHENWSQLIEDQQLSDREKLQIVREKAIRLQSLAGRKERGDEQEVADSLYLESIEAKLALLQRA